MIDKTMFAVLRMLPGGAGCDFSGWFVGENAGARYLGVKLSQLKVT